MNRNTIIRLSFVFLAVILFSGSGFAQNMGINSSGATPRDCAMLDVVSSNTGLLIPSLTLTNVTVYAPATGTPVDGLLVYSNAAPTGGGGVGYYYWSTSAAPNQWVNLVDVLNPGSAWMLNGNAGSTVGTNFVGTTDNNDLEFKVNNIKAGLIDIASQCTFFGFQAGLANTAIYSTFIGYNAGVVNTTGIANTGIGVYALTNCVSGGYNTAVGVQALEYATGSNNTAVGINAGYSINSGSLNTALGYYAMNNGNASDISGSNNTAIGSGAGSLCGSDTYNTFLGFNSNPSSTGFTNATALGSYSFVGANNSMVLGSIAGVNGAGASTKVGIGITTPSTALEVGQNNAIKLGTALLSCGGANYLHLGNNTWFDGTSWQFPIVNQAGALIQMAGQDINFWIHGGNVASFSENMTIQGATGNVGIGDAPAYKLDVNGDIRAVGSVYYGGAAGVANGTLYSKPDFVFKPTYKIYNTKETEQFIRLNGHLPWVTSAVQEQKDNKSAVDMTRMSFETLEAVENLQLQIIEQQKLILELKKEIDLLKKK